jgi:hypothetical protein
MFVFNANWGAIPILSIAVAFIGGNRRGIGGHRRLGFFPNHDHDH